MSDSNDVFIVKDVEKKHNYSTNGLTKSGAIVISSSYDRLCIFFRLCDNLASNFFHILKVLVLIPLYLKQQCMRR